MKSAFYLSALVALYGSLVAGTPNPMMPIETEDPALTTPVTTGGASTSMAPSVTVTAHAAADVQQNPVRAPFHTGQCSLTLGQQSLKPGLARDVPWQQVHWQVWIIPSFQIIPQLLLRKRKSLH
jgi:hypothetical protein